METTELRKKLIVSSSKFIQDDIKLEILERVFDTINNEEMSAAVSDEHYLKVEETTAAYLSGTNAVSS